MPLALTAAILHLGLMDGSGGIAVSHDEFLTVSDEVNWIKRYAVADGSVGSMALDLNGEKNWFKARPNPKHSKLFLEADVEGAAQVGEVIYWIGSHGYHKKEAQDHQVFFATKLGKHREITPQGEVYRRLLEDLIAEKSLKEFGLEEASGIKPKEPGGLNIEALGTAADGKTLLIGFRNPLVNDHKALVVPLLNPAELVTAGEARAKFGKAILLDLGGLGLRDMVWWRGKYLFLAGHYKSHLSDKDGEVDPAVPASRLYRWSGDPEEDPVWLKDLDLGTLNPEALIVFPDERVLILSDDGSALNGSGVPQKDAFKDDPTHSTGQFRSVWLVGRE
jgi:Protein of unknown function (DUF3616)